MLRGAAALLILLAAAPAFARDPAVVRAFRKDHPCPSTQRTTGACPGWVVDHLWPLCAGGPDAVWNMAWQELAASKRKDRIERQACADLKKACSRP
jgi:hypothetical protein